MWFAGAYRPYAAKLFGPTVQKVSQAVRFRYLRFKYFLFNICLGYFGRATKIVFKHFCVIQHTKVMKHEHLVVEHPDAISKNHVAFAQSIHETHGDRVTWADVEKCLVRFCL
jgi:hypothetical protein